MTAAVANPSGITEERNFKVTFPLVAECLHRTECELQTRLGGSVTIGLRILPTGVESKRVIVMLHDASRSRSVAAVVLTWNPEDVVLNQGRLLKVKARTHGGPGGVAFARLLREELIVSLDGLRWGRS